MRIKKRKSHVEEVSELDTTVIIPVQRQRQDIELSPNGRWWLYRIWIQRPRRIKTG